MVDLAIWIPIGLEAIGVGLAAYAANKDPKRETEFDPILVDRFNELRAFRAGARTKIDGAAKSLLAVNFHQGGLKGQVAASDANLESFERGFASESAQERTRSRRSGTAINPQTRSISRAKKSIDLLDERRKKRLAK